MDQELNNIDFQELRDKAYMFRYELFDDLDKHLLKLEEEFQKNGVNFSWAKDQQSLFSEIAACLPHSSYNTATLDLDGFSDLSLGDNMVNIYPLEDIINHHQNVDTLVVNADYAISSTGELVFINRKSQHCFNKISNLVVVLNLDQIVSSQEELDVILYLRKYANPNNVPHDLKFISRNFDRVVQDEFITSDSKGYSTEPVNVSVILYENNITPILRNNRLRDALFCIKCGKCMEVCPVAKVAGGVSPIELVKSTCLNPLTHSQDIFQKTTLCGNCKEACPIGINFTDLLIFVMNMINDKTSNTKSKKFLNIIHKRGKLNKYNSRILRWYLVKKMFGKNRVLFDYFRHQKDTFFNLVNKDNTESDESSFEL